MPPEERVPETRGVAIALAVGFLLVAGFATKYVADGERRSPEVASDRPAHSAAAAFLATETASADRPTLR